MYSNRVIPAGGSIQLTLAVMAAIDGPGGPEWNLDEVNGRYRLDLGLNVEGSAMSPIVPSNAFTLTERP